MKRLQDANVVIEDLRVQLSERSPAPANPSKPGGRYDVSFNVLVIENGGTVSVPLSQVLDKSYLRPDQREADTPCNYHGGGSFSPEAGRSSEHFTRYSVDERGGSVDSSDDGRQGSVQMFHSPGQKGDLSPVTQPSTMALANRAKIVPLKLALARPQSLDSNAIVSHHTLHEFNRQFAGQGGVTSPMSSYARGVYRYVTRTFAEENNFSHKQADVEGFGRTLSSLCSEVEAILRNEPRHPSVASPCYVFGDLHGNCRDLHYFMKNLITFGDLRYTPHRFVFLGDYVDRGDFSVEVVAYLFSMKVLAPDKVVLLRGNHEDTLVSGDLGSYGATSFRAQCRQLFGALLGEELWRKASRVFSFLPLTANIDGRIFCTHGGLPRYKGGADQRLELLTRPEFPAFESFFQIPEGESAEQKMCREAATDTCWSDPAEDERTLDNHGFGPNPRGNGVILFGTKAVDDFLDRFGFEYIFRAHQEKADGLKLSKSARVFTIFSTSAYVGHSNGAGVVLVAENKIRLIIKNPDEEVE